MAQEILIAWFSERGNKFQKLIRFGRHPGTPGGKEFLVRRIKPGGDKTLARFDMNVDDTWVTLAAGSGQNRTGMGLIGLLIFRKTDIAVYAKYTAFGVALDRKPFRTPVRGKFGYQTLHHELYVAVVCVLSGLEPGSVVIFLQPREEIERRYGETREVGADVIGEL